MRTKTIAMLLAAALLPLAAMAQDEMPQINPLATYTDDDGDEQSTTTVSGNAPLDVHFDVGATNTDGWTCNYEWRFYREGEEGSPYLTRYDETVDYTFTEAGSHRIVCYATFFNGTDTIAYGADYWDETDPITVTISESELVMPNAFSPNGDGINDVYKPKEGWKSIIEFHGYIFNRWGQLLYDWTDPDDGWDGTYKGKDVKQGVYFCLVKAKGADGRTFNIRKDVNLLRGYTENSGANTTE